MPPAGGVHILFYNGIWCGILDVTTGRPTRERKMITKHIVVEPFDEHWRLDFLKIQNELTDALGQLAAPSNAGHLRRGDTVQ